MPLAVPSPHTEDRSKHTDTETSHSNATVAKAPFWHVYRGAPSSSSALYPHTLTSGPESGLCNQLMALVGYAMIFHSNGKRFSALILPDFTSHDRGGVDEPFTRLFDPGPMIESLAAVGIVARAQPLPGERVCRPGAMSGWRAYKTNALPYKKNATKNAHRGLHRNPMQRFEDAVYRGLQPSVGVRRRVRQVQAQLGLQPGAYGCVHTRIEIDVKRSWPIMHTGPPALLGDYYDALAQAEAELNGAKRIFAAVGSVITAREREELDSRSTSWGAPLARSTLGKSHHRGKKNASASSYVDAALVDFFVCRGAIWLAGWSGSTFLRTLARLQKLGSGRGWYSVCPSVLPRTKQTPRMQTGDTMQYLDGDDVLATWRMCSIDCNATSCHGSFRSVVAGTTNRSSTRAAAQATALEPLRAGHAVSCGLWNGSRLVD